MALPQRQQLMFTDRSPEVPAPCCCGSSSPAPHWRGPRRPPPFASPAARAGEAPPEARPGERA